jgi:hypothetical protein
MNRRDYLSDAEPGDDPRLLPYLTPEQCRILIIPVCGIALVIFVILFGFYYLAKQKGEHLRPQVESKPRVEASPRSSANRETLDHFTIQPAGALAYPADKRSVGSPAPPLRL